MKSIDDYFTAYPPEVQNRLQLMRKIIREAAPEAVEDIKWGMPTFVQHGNLVHFAAHQNHIGFYPDPTAIDHFKNDMQDFKHSKGAVQFPHNRDIPVDLVKKMVCFRVQQNQLKHSKKSAINK